jgi:hypothetical protein
MNVCATEISNCCGVGIYPDSDICSECKEHCGSIREEEDEEGER